jgi:hypothetical protein
MLPKVFLWIMEGLLKLIKNYLLMLFKLPKVLKRLPRDYLGYLGATMGIEGCLRVVYAM